MFHSSLISNCLNLPFGNSRSRRLEPISYKQVMGNTKASMSRSVTESCAVSVVLKSTG